MLADKCQSIHWFHYLSRPAVLKRFDLRKSFPCPFFQAFKAFIEIVRLPSLMVLASNHKQVGITTLAFHQANVVVRIRCVPEQGAFTISSRDAGSYYISPVRRIDRIKPISF